MFNNKILQGLLGLLAAVLVLFVAAKTFNAFREYHYIGKAGRDTIVIDGQGKISAAPDVAQISLGVQSEGRTVKETQTQNTLKMNAIVAALKDLSISDKDVQTSNYSISPRYDYKDGTQTLAGYTVSQNVTVKVRDLDSVGAVLGKAGELGANNIGGVQFTIDDPSAVQAQARLKAIADARKKAEQLAAQLGLTIVKVVTFNESSNNEPRPMYKAYDMIASQAAPSAPPVPEIASGSLDVVSNVNVTFEIR